MAVPANRGPAAASGAPRGLLGVAAPSLRACLRDAREEGTNLRLPVPAVTAQGTDGGELACLRPPGDGLGIHAEHRGDLCRCQQGLGFRGTCGHEYGPSSRFSTAVMRVALPHSRAKLV